MAEIALVSDIHDNQNNLGLAVKAINEAGVDLTLFLGDLCAPFTLSKFENLDCPLKGVFGNNDGDREAINRRLKSFDTSFSDLLKLEQGGRRIACFHGTNPSETEKLVKSGLYDLVATGHTHKRLIKKEGDTLHVNPGEVCGYLTANPSYAIVDLDELEGELIGV